MSRKTAVLFPGQGAQYVGMGRDFYEQFPVARHIFEEADAILGQAFSKLIFEGDKDKLLETKNSQPAIYTVSFAMYRVLREECPGLVPYVCAGLSLGEYTALAAAEKISFAEGLRLVTLRAYLMQEACFMAPGSLRVVLGMEEEAVRLVLDACSGENYACIANLNCPGQIVIAGTNKGLELATEELKKAGAKRVLPLDVSGAFHSELMRPAREGLAPALLEVPLVESAIKFVMNTPGDFVEELDLVRRYLIEQMTSPVYWQKGIEAMDPCVDEFLEVGCGKTLQGMNKRIGVRAPTYGIETVGELEQFLKGVDHVIA